MNTRRRRLLSLLASGVLVVTLLHGTAGSADPQGPTRSTTSRLGDKRYVAAGDRAYTIGTLAGRFPPMGWHIRGEMGGVWAHPVKLLDGYWFSLNGNWIPPASSFTSGPGYARMAFPDTAGLEVSRTEFSPDGSPVTLVGLTLRNPNGGDRTFSIDLDLRSEIMSAYPWGWTTPSAKSFNGPDVASFSPKSGGLTFRESGKPWYAVVGSSLRPARGSTGDSFWGPVPPAERADYLENGNGTGGRLSWNLNLGGGREKTLWVAVGGSHSSAGEANAAVDSALSDPEALLSSKVAARRELLARTQVSLPDPSLQAAFDWGKLNMADLRRTVTDARIRDVDEGRRYPPPMATVPRLTGIGAGFPDYPWFFGTDGAYTAFPLVASGQWDLAMDHLRGIRDVSRILNGTTGKVAHEVVTEGSVYWGANDDPGNTNETAQFATAVDLLWRWTGNDTFRDEMYGFVRDGMRYITSAGCPFGRDADGNVTEGGTCDNDGDGWPEGRGMVERPGMGSEKLDVTAYTWQALRALEDMAQSKGDQETASWAGARADDMQARFDPTWWMSSENLYADSLCNSYDTGTEGENVCTAEGQQLQQRHWINATPMEALLAPKGHATSALTRLESSTFTGSCGLFHTGAGGGPAGTGELKCWTLPGSVMAVGEANYGRLGPRQAPYYMRSIADQLDLEMPGALPEIAPSPEYEPFVDFRDRAMFMQAWSSYGVQWPVIHHFLGVRPDVPAGGLYVVPDIPEGWPGLSVAELRVGSGTVQASATRSGSKTYETRVTAPAGWRLTIGHTLEARA
ncbi:MAG: glycogen debranching protein, partial [Actinomycetota bacterium]